MIDKSLSRGLADRVLDEMADLARTYPAACRHALRSIPEKRHSVRAVADALLVAGEAACVTQIISTHPKWRWAGTCAFIPEVQRLEGGRMRTIAFQTVRIYAHIGRLPLAQCETGIVLAVHEHAIERLFQRLNVLDAAAVREELHDAMCLAVPLLNASRQLHHQQAVLPTRSGAFLCTVDEDGAGLVAKTWIPRAEESSRHAGPSRIAKEYFIGSGGEQGIGLEIGALPIATSLSAIQVPDSLLRELERTTWLRGPYERRPDPVGQLWAAARLQRDAA